MLEARLILVHLLIKLGVAAALSSALVRSQEFKKLLFREDRDTAHKIYLALWMAIPIALGVMIRFSAKSFLAGDLSLETALILGVVGGRLSGSLGGALVALPALLHGEWAALPLYAFAGGIAGQLRRIAPEQDDIWSFSPFVDLSLYRMIRRNLPRPRVFDWQIAFFATIAGLRFLETEIWRYVPGSIFSLESTNLWVEGAIYLTVITVVGTELKIFNSVRLQIKLEEQERLLLQARMTALQNQINPHFLFNTLNSISSLVRFDPDTAREMILKLATILRRLLNSTDSFVPLHEEVAFIDNYLDIEVVRPPLARPALTPTMFCSAIPTFTRRSGKRFWNSFRLEEPTESFTTATILGSLSASPISALENAWRQSCIEFIPPPPDLSKRRIQFFRCGNAMVPLHSILHERNAAAFARAGDDAVRPPLFERNGA